LGEEQVPQLRTALHPSETPPQLSPSCAQVNGVQVVPLAPQTFGNPFPPHALPAAQAAPQVTVPPQPFGIWPQL
jgi:hypothetical protein